MKVYQAGLRPVVAMMGSALYEAQHWVLIERFRHVTLLMDGGSTGRKASTVIAHKLRPHCSVRVILLADGLQPDQMSAKDIVDALRNFANDD